MTHCLENIIGSCLPSDWIGIFQWRVQCVLCQENPYLLLGTKLWLPVDHDLWILQTRYFVSKNLLHVDSSSKTIQSGFVSAQEKMCYKSDYLHNEAGEKVKAELIFFADLNLCLWFMLGFFLPLLVYFNIHASGFSAFAPCLTQDQLMNFRKSSESWITSVQLSCNSKAALICNELMIF